MDFWGQKVILFKFAKKGALIRTGQVVAVAFYMRRYGIYGIKVIHTDSYMFQKAIF